MGADDLVTSKDSANETNVDDSKIDQENVEFNIAANKKGKSNGKIHKNDTNSSTKSGKNVEENIEKNEQISTSHKNKTFPSKGKKGTGNTEPTLQAPKSSKTRNKQRGKFVMTEEEIRNNDDIINDNVEFEIKSDESDKNEKEKKGTDTKKEKKVYTKDDNEVTTALDTKIKESDKVKKDVIANYSTEVATPSETKTKQSAKGKRGTSKNADTVEKKIDSAIEPPNKKSKKDDKPLKNKSSTAFDSIDFTNSSVDSRGNPWNFKISSWNVDGIRAWQSKGGLEYIKHEKPDILCLQEVKCSQQKLPGEVADIEGYHPYWLCSEKDGYAGVGIYTTKVPINVKYGIDDEELDSEGRIITAEYEEFYLICTYVPNAGRKLVTLPKKLKWNEIFHKYVKALDSKKPVIICGDMNVAHNEIDLTNPKTNKKNAGFTEEERAGMTALLKDGFVDTFRHLNPDKAGAYTFWTYMMNSRAKNVGWRLDYLIVSERLLPSVCDSVIRSEVFGSDHCPITLCLNLNSA